MTTLRYTLMLALVFLPASPFATTFPVTKTADTNDGTCDPDCSLREAIEAANTSPGADDVPVPAGTYLLKLGQLVVSDDVNIAGAGQATTIIDGNATDRVFKIQASTAVEMSNINIQGGAPYDLYGGGIVNEGDLALDNCTVVGNFASDNWYNGIGGGIFNVGGALNLNNSTVSYNTTQGIGGGIYNRSGAVSLTNSTVSGNHTGDAGGGVYNRAGAVIVTNSLVSNNHVFNGFFQGRGGGILNRGDLKITNSTVSGNEAGYRYYGFTGYGGGVFNGGTAVITNSTISGNGANASGGGILGAATLHNTIVADNYINNCSESMDSLGYNLADDDSCGLAGPGDLVVADAMLAPLADNGGSTRTHALLPGSPAIDAGSADCPPPDTDQRGVIRPQGSACDIGAVEFVLAATLVKSDIQPGSDSNPIHFPGRYSITVAILGADVVDVRDVDLTSLTFGPDAAAPLHDLTEPKVFKSHVRDVNHDGFADLVSHYQTLQTGISPDDLQACITGEIQGGARFDACDVIQVVSPNRRTLFTTSTSFAVGDAPASVAISDLDGDSVLDLVTVNTRSHDVSVLLGIGDGRFLAARSYAVGTSPRSIAIGDFNGDSVLDLVTANAQSDDVTVLMGNGDGTFQAGVSHPVGDVPFTVTVSDLDSDSVLDLAAANFTGDDVSVLLGNGDGRFQPPMSFATGRFDGFVTAADLDDDSVPDLVTGSMGGGNFVHVLLGNGDGSFEAPLRYEAGDGTGFVAVADVDSDRVPDLITANSNANDVSVLLGNGDATFQSPDLFPAGVSPRSIAVADLDFDRVLDLAVANAGSNDVTVLLGNGDGTFEGTETLDAADRPIFIAAADLDGNGTLDLVTANYWSDDVRVFLNDSRTGRTPRNRR